MVNRFYNLLLLWSYRKGSTVCSNDIVDDDDYNDCRFRISRISRRRKISHTHDCSAVDPVVCRWTGATKIKSNGKKTARKKEESIGSCARFSPIKIYTHRALELRRRRRLCLSICFVVSAVVCLLPLQFYCKSFSLLLLVCAAMQRHVTPERYRFSFSKWKIKSTKRNKTAHEINSCARWSVDLLPARKK